MSFKLGATYVLIKIFSPMHNKIVSELLRCKFLLHFQSRGIVAVLDELLPQTLIDQLLKGGLLREVQFQALFTHKSSYTTLCGNWQPGTGMP